MTASEFIGLLFLVLACLGWSRAMDRALTLRDADIARAWTYLRNDYVAPRRNRRTR